MSIGPGTRLGPYEVVSPLGAGGMGEVYRARDTRLNRDVALKVLPEIFAADPERLARFEREAQALASLKHPHIATIHGIEEKAGVRALVLELVDGDTLAELLARGPLPVDEAVRIARQIADALDAAHEQGIIHRDLKPANIKITPDGVVKVLDFGLAKLAGPADGRAYGDVSAATRLAGSDVTALPTMASPAMLTAATVLMGTASYMAPEQARGKVVDKRADIWAFGVVLYEMLTGARAFAGESVTEVAGAVIHKGLDFTALPATTPAAVRMVLERCLQKDARHRFRDMGDVRLALDGAFTHAVSTAAAAAPPASIVRRAMPIVAAAALAAMLAGAGVWMATRGEAVPTQARQLELLPVAADMLSPFIDISPDGRHISFVASDGPNNSIPRLWVRSLDSTESRRVAAAEETFFPGHFWSPDSRYVAFFADGKLRKVPLAGGPAETIAETKTFTGGSWGRTGHIVFSTGVGLMRVPATGGQPVALDGLSKLGGDLMLPSFLPDGEHFLYLRMSSNDNTTGVYVGSVDPATNEGDQTRLIAARQGAIYAPAPGGQAGHVLFIRDGLLMAQEFDDRQMTLRGEAVPIGKAPVETFSVFAAFGVSADGTLIYRRGGGSPGALTALDRTGAATPLLDGVNAERARNPRVSPDGRSLALIVDGQLWVYDLGGRPPIKLTFDGDYYMPLWTRDSRRIVVERGGNDRSQWIASADGSGTPEAIGPKGHYHAYGWTADGREIVAARLENNNPDLVRFGTAADAQVQEVVATPASDGTSGAVSPDGRWVAYSTDTTGRAEIWVRALADAGAPVRVSPNSGSEPIWSGDGRELYYIEGGFRMMTVSVQAGSGFNFEPPVELFIPRNVGGAQPPSYDVTRDGRFVMFTTPEQAGAPISVILNWTELLKDRAAAR